MRPDDIGLKSDEIPLHPVIRGLAEKFEDVDWSESHSQDVAHVPADLWKAFAEEAQKAGFEFCSDVTAVDWMRQRSDRFEVVVNLLSMTTCPPPPNEHHLEP